MNSIVVLNLIFETLTFFFVMAITFAAARVVGDALNLRRRLGHARAADPGSGASYLAIRGFTNPFLAWVQKSSSISDPGQSGKLIRDLALAGFRHPAAPVWYVIIRFSLAIGLPLAFLFNRQLSGQPVTGAGPIFWSFILCAIGLLAPRSFVDRRAQARRARLEQEFPDALDLMVVCVEAGLGLDATFVRVGQEMRQSHPRIVAELALVSEVLRAGQSQAQALRAMAERCDIAGVKSFAALVIQTESIGASIAQSLRTYSHEMRETRLLKAEEKAMRIPVVMTLPLVACVLPVIIVALLLPAIIDVVRVLLPTLYAGVGQ